MENHIDKFSWSHFSNVTFISHIINHVGLIIFYLSIECFYVVLN